MAPDVDTELATKQRAKNLGSANAGRVITCRTIPNNSVPNNAVPDNSVPGNSVLESPHVPGKSKIMV